MRYSLIFICFIFLGQAYGQNKPIYILKNRYNERTNQLIERSSIDFKQYRILVNYQLVMVDNGDAIDYRRVRSWIKKFFPGKNDEGLLCIDLENILYNRLKTKSPDSDEYQADVDEFVKLINFIKKERPKLTVGFWSLLFKNSTTKLDPIFKAADVLFPYCYLSAPAEVNGLQANFDYLKNQLDIAFRFADRLNKPVIPFFWYLTHGADRTLRREQIPREEMFEYIKYVENYRSPAGLEISGIAWWDTPTSYSRNVIKRNYMQQANKWKGSKPMTIDQTFSYYFDL